jgi:hypothetical protein
VNTIDSLFSFLTLSLFQNTAGLLGSGIDIKSVLLNIACTLLLLLPFVAYFASQYVQEAMMAVVVSFAVAFLAPPWGWRRPHPYSDDPKNLPYPMKAD